MCVFNTFRHVAEQVTSSAKMSETKDNIIYCLFIFFSHGGEKVDNYVQLITSEYIQHPWKQQKLVWNICLHLGPGSYIVTYICLKRAQSFVWTDVPQMWSRGTYCDFNKNTEDGPNQSKEKYSPVPHTTKVFFHFKVTFGLIQSTEHSH